jgi:hypothetical protein
LAVSPLADGTDVILVVFQSRGALECFDAGMESLMLFMDMPGCAGKAASEKGSRRYQAEG